MDAADLLDQFEAWQNYAALSPRTIGRRRRTVQRFAEVHPDLGSVKPVDIETWLGGLRVEAQSRAQYLADLRAFWRWALDHELLAIDPAARVRPPKFERKGPEPIKTADLIAAIDAAPERVRVMLTLAGFAGLRCIEIARLRFEDADLDAGNLKVWGKGNRHRTVAMHPRIAALFEPGATGPVVSWHGRPVTAGAISDVLADYLHGRGLKSTGHKARHSYGTGLYEACHDLITVGAQLGHSSPNTTKGYVEPSDDSARAAIAKLYESCA